jgi:hypothetical protein
MFLSSKIMLKWLQAIKKYVQNDKESEYFYRNKDLQKKIWIHINIKWESWATAHSLHT